jgi:hypothetical protein
LRVCISDEVINFRYREPDIYRNRDQAQPGTSIDELEIVRFIWQEQSQTVAGSKSVFAERCGNASNTIAKLPKRPSRLA